MKWVTAKREAIFQDKMMNETSITELAHESEASRLCEWRFRKTAVASEAKAKRANKSKIWQAGNQEKRKKLMIIFYATLSVHRERIRWWPRVRKTPVPIPNTVEKTHIGDNTWRATAWEDNSLPAPNLRKRRNKTRVYSFFFYIGESITL